jgi:demethylmenaquinone methyltransferase/2-methoxy-6-polyprenyl-1,4-benzoquinol methylase
MAQIAKMFDKIAPRYDSLNHFMSFRLDKKWRKKTVSLLRDIKNPVLLDLATGTGDLAIELTKLKPISIYAADISPKMLEIATRKINRKRLQMTIFPKQASSENLPFDKNTFNAVTVSFGIRNFENPAKSLQEIYRVLKPKGKVIIMEFSMPNNSIIKPLYLFYLTKIIPLWGHLFSKNKAAYKYLSESIMQFSQQVDVEALFLQSGLTPIKNVKQTFGIVTIYVAEKEVE